MGDYGRLHKKQCAAMHYAKPDITTLSSNAAHDTHAWEKSHESCAVLYWTLNSCTPPCAHSHNPHGENFHGQSPEALRGHIMTQTRMLFLIRTRTELSTVRYWICTGSARNLDADPAQVVGVELALQVVGVELALQIVEVEQVIENGLVFADIRKPDLVDGNS